MTFTGLLVHTVTPKTKASSQNALGEWTYTYTNGTAIDCRCSPISNAQRMESPGYFDDVKYQCFMVSSSIKKGDHVVYNAEDYLVKGCGFDSSTHHKTADLALIT